MKKGRRGGGEGKGGTCGFPGSCIYSQKIAPIKKNRGGRAPPARLANKEKKKNIIRGMIRNKREEVEGGEVKAGVSFDASWYNPVEK